MGPPVSRSRSVAARRRRPVSAGQPLVVDSGKAERAQLSVPAFRSGGLEIRGQYAGLGTNGAHSRRKENAVSSWPWHTRLRSGINGTHRLGILENTAHQKRPKRLRDGPMDEVTRVPIKNRMDSPIGVGKDQDP